MTPILRRDACLLLAASATLLAACTDGLTDDAPDDNGAPTAARRLGPGESPTTATAAPTAGAPAVRIAFPPGRSHTDATSIVLRGRASDPDGIAAIRVNGALATTTDDFANWRFEAALEPGRNTFVVEAEDAAGNVDTAAAQAVVISRPLTLLGTGITIALEPGGGRVLVADRTPPQLLAIDRASGRRAVISGPTRGAGPALEDITSMVVVPATGAILVTERTPRRVLAIDPATGDRRILSGPTTGSGPLLGEPRGIAFDPVTGAALVADPLAERLYSIDLATGARTIVSGEGVRGTGVALYYGQNVALDPVGRRAFLRIGGGYPQIGIVAVDLATGNRTMASGFGVGTGSDLVAPGLMAYDAAHGQLLGADVSDLFTIDLATGNRSKYLTGRDFLFVTELILDPTTGRALVLDQFRGAVLDVDPVTGEGDAFREPDLGDGPAIATPHRVILDGADRAIVLDDTLVDRTVTRIDLGTEARQLMLPRPDDLGNSARIDLLFAEDLAAGTLPGHAVLLTNSLVDFDLATGTRSLVNGSSTASSPDLQDPFAVVVDPASQRAFVADRELDAIIAIDLTTGTRSLFASLPPLLSYTSGDLALDPVGHRLLFVEGYNRDVLAIDLTTAAVSTASPGKLSGFGYLLAIGVDGPAQRAYAADFDKLVEIDLATGARRLFAGATSSAGFGPKLRRPTSIAVDALDHRAIVTDEIGIWNSIVMAIDLETGHRVIVSFP